MSPCEGEIRRAFFGLNEEAPTQAAGGRRRRGGATWAAAAVWGREGLVQVDVHRIDAEIGDIVQPLDDAGKIADAVAIGILKRARIDLIDYRAAPPFGIGFRS